MHIVLEKLTQRQAKVELKLWQQQGKNLLALVKLQHSEQGFSLCIPGYRCNNWYQLSNRYYCNQQAALAAYGKLLDSLSADICNTESSSKRSTHISSEAAA